MSIIAPDLNTFVVSSVLCSNSFIAKVSQTLQWSWSRGLMEDHLSAALLKFPSPSRTLKDSCSMIYAFQVVVSIFLTF